MGAGGLEADFWGAARSLSGRIACVSCDSPYENAPFLLLFVAVLSVLRCHPLAHALQIFGRVHAGAWGTGRQVHRNAVAMPQRTQLLQGFEDFGRRLGQGGELAQKLRTVAVDADMAQRRKAWTATPPVLIGMVAGIRNGGARPVPL